MGIRSAVLVLDDLEFDLNDPSSTGLVVDTITLASPSLKEVMSDLPGQDGNYDQTKNFSARTLSITGYASGYGTVGSRQQVIDSLAPFCNPTKRPSLVYAFDTDVIERTIGLRVSQWSGPISAGQGSAIQYQWVCPDPISYGLATNEVDIPPSSGASTGRIYSLTFPRVYPVSFGGTGTAFVTTSGTFPSWPIIRLFGPINLSEGGIYWLDPVTNVQLGIQIVLDGISVLAGDYLEINTKARTVTLNGDPNANRYSFVDFSNTTWGPLQPGANQLQFAVTSASAPALAQILWQDAYLQ